MSAYNIITSSLIGMAYIKYLKQEPVDMIYLLLSILSSAIMAIALRLFQDPKGNRYGILLGNYLVCVLISFIRLPDHSQVFRGSAVTILWGIVSGFLFVAGLVTMQTSIRLNGATLTAVFSKLGLIVSLAVSILVYGERPNVLQIIGLLLVLTAIILINGGDGSETTKGKRLYTGALFLTLLAGGAAGATAKVFEQIGAREEDELYFLYLFAVAALLTFLLALVEKRKQGLKVRAKDLAAGIVIGIPNYYASFLLLPALTVLPAFIVYPVSSTGVILLVSAAGALFFHEKHTAKQKLGILLVLAALVLLNL